MRPRRRRTRSPRPMQPGGTPDNQNDGNDGPENDSPADLFRAGDGGSVNQEEPGAPTVSDSATSNTTSTSGTPNNDTPGGGARRDDGGDDMGGRGRRRRRRGRGGRPEGNAPRQSSQQAAPRPSSNGGGRRDDRRGREGAREGGRDNARRGRRDNRGTSGGGRPQRRGLDILKDLQQAGAALDPTERLILELPVGVGNPPYGDHITGRAIDLIAPIGRGQRCLLVAPPKAGKTRILQAIAASIAHNHPDVAVYALLVDERPEEVTDFKRNTPAIVIAASSDMSVDEHIQTAEMAMETVAAEVIAGKDVVLLLDSITRLARAYTASAGNGGRTMSGGLDSNAMQSPRQIFGSARKIENGGSLTIIGTALVDTGSRMDQIIFEEFKGTGNSEIYLSRELAERRIYPAIDIAKSGTRKEEKLIPPDLLGTFHALRRVLVGMPPQEAMNKLVDRLGKTKTNTEFFAMVRVGES